MDKKITKHGNLIEVKTDCFAYNPKGKHKCVALNGLYCKTEKCNFYKKDRMGKVIDY